MPAGKASSNTDVQPYSLTRLLGTFPTRINVLGGCAQGNFLLPQVAKRVVKNQVQACRIQSLSTLIGHTRDASKSLVSVRQ